MQIHVYEVDTLFYSGFVETVYKTDMLIVSMNNSGTNFDNMKGWKYLSQQSLLNESSNLY